MKRYFMVKEVNNKKPKIMLHSRSRNQISGPNVANDIIFNSFLKEKYSFCFLEHTPRKGFISNVLAIKYLILQIKQFNPDIIHVSGLMRAGFEAVIAARICRKKVLLTIRGSSSDAISFKKKIMYTKIFEPITMRLSHRVYTVCNAMATRDYIKRHTKNRMIGTIHNSAPNVNYADIKSYRLREKYGIDKDAVIVAIVGRMIYDKGITFVAEAIKKIESKKIVFVFIGDGPIIEKIKVKLNKDITTNRVILLGKQSNVLSILKDCDIFLFATLHENLSNALLEACSLGLAVIATNVGGNPEIIKHNFNGLLIEKANTDEITRSILLLSEDENLRNILGNNAVNTIQSEFSQAKLLKKLEKVYDELFI